MNRYSESIIGTTDTRGGDSLNKSTKPKNLWFFQVRGSWQDSLAMKSIRRKHEEKFFEVFGTYMQLLSFIIRTCTGDEESYIIPVSSDSNDKKINFETLQMMIDSPLDVSDLEEDISIMSESICPLCEIIDSEGLNILMYDDMLILDSTRFESVDKRKRRQKQKEDAIKKDSVNLNDSDHRLSDDDVSNMSDSDFGNFVDEQKKRKVKK